MGFQYKLEPAKESVLAVLGGTLLCIILIPVLLVTAAYLYYKWLDFSMKPGKKNKTLADELRSTADWCSRGMLDYAERDRLFPFSHSDYGLTDKSKDGKPAANPVSGRHVASKTYAEFLTRLVKFSEGVAGIRDMKTATKQIDKLYTTCFRKAEFVFTDSSSKTLKTINFRLSSGAKWPNSDWFTQDAEDIVNNVFKKLSSPLTRIAATVEKIMPTGNESADLKLKEDKPELGGRVNYLRIAKFINQAIDWVSVDADVSNLGRICDKMSLFWDNDYYGNTSDSTSKVADEWDYAAPKPESDHYLK